jgi:MbtH protein
MSEGKDEKAKDSMNTSKKEKEIIFKVVVNQKEQYSIWPADQRTPNGWEMVGPTGIKEVCLSYVKKEGRQ